MDRFDFDVREQIPNSGLDTLPQFGAPKNIIARLSAVEEWRAMKQTPADWAAQVNDWAQSRLVTEALDEAAEALDGPGEITCDVLASGKGCAAAEAASCSRPAAQRSEVLSAHEARQWVLPVVFVCGMVEKQFPQFHRQDPFFPRTRREDRSMATESGCARRSSSSGRSGRYSKRR